MPRRLGIVREEASNYHDIADADAAEAKSCQELLSKMQDVAKSNSNITSDLHVLVQEEKLAEDELRQQVWALKAELGIA